MLWQGDRVSGQGFPWARLLQAALRLGLAPDAFWKLSLREWRLITATKSEGGFGKKALSRLLAAFPDKE